MVSGRDHQHGHRPGADHGDTLQQAHFAAEIAERGKIVAIPRLVAAIPRPGIDRRHPAEAESS